VDRAILGGLVVQTGDTVIDASLATRLQQLRRRLAGV
jgi:F0F1-type ATP synthase delta subunit